MLLSRDARRKLAALHGGSEHAQRERAAHTAEDSSEESVVATVVAPNPEMPAGQVVQHSLGSYLSIRVTPADIGAWAEEVAGRVFTELARTAALPIEAPHQVAFLDLETTGLSSTPVFLIGLLHVGGQGPHVHQLLARDYSEEEAALAAGLDLLSGAKVLVSFNGRSFDVPFLRDRTRYHRMEWTVAPERHVDVLWVARRQRDLQVPNHRLLTLESRVCGRYRAGDIPGELIPAAYHRFVDTGETDEMALILQHNQIDLLTTAELAAQWPEGIAPSRSTR